MPDPTAEEVAEASAKMAAEFEMQATDMRQYWEQQLDTERHRIRWLIVATTAPFRKLRNAQSHLLGPGHLAETSARSSCHLLSGALRSPRSSWARLARERHLWHQCQCTKEATQLSLHNLDPEGS